MAYVGTATLPKTDRFSRLAGVVATLGGRLARYRDFVRTVRALERLDDRTLDDLGISQGEIVSVAHDAVYGRK